MTLPEGPPASQPQGRDATRRLASSALLIAVLGIGTILRLSEGISGGVWLDEHHTLLLAGAPTISEVLARTSMEAHPPAYLIALHLVMRLVGEDPLVAKGLSVLCGVATLLLVALAAHRRRGVLSAIVASTVLGGSAVAVHFATEIRPYAVVALTILVGLLATVSAVERPTLWRLLAQAGALIVALGLNFLALVLLPVGPLLGLLRAKPRLVAKQLLIGAVAVLVTSPPLVRVATELPPEANEYLQTFWQGRTAVDALVVVGRDLLPSGRWPPAYGSTARRTGFDQGLEAFAMAGVVLVLAGAGAAGFARGGSRRLDLLDAGCAALLASAAALASASFLLGRPVVTPGRFAASFLPVVALLAGTAAAWGSVGRVGSLLLAAVAAANAGATLVGSEQDGVRIDRNELVSVVAARELRGPLLVISVGLTGTPLKYELRTRRDVSFASYPVEVDSHFGWWAPQKALSEPGALRRDAAMLTGRAVAAAREGRIVLLTGGDHPVAAPLHAALSQAFLARPLHPLARGASVLVLREAVPGPASQRR